ncbi:hypothetical protein CDD82_6299 [Ophiocordyceps australis]|uniref:Uncharacterized protein n=1 Tax=Ophiocordyceps australis TaxID=1399860 RepID=A0A2C5YWF3_9HYPO|nr:hypothetical protein CDD82_6299 [Ophiocordyceps australis]
MFGHSTGADDVEAAAAVAGEVAAEEADEVPKVLVPERMLMTPVSVEKPSGSITNTLGALVTLGSATEWWNARDIVRAAAYDTNAIGTAA